LLPKGNKSLSTGSQGTWRAICDHPLRFWLENGSSSRSISCIFAIGALAVRIAKDSFAGRR
jgi:hypothetical protein